MPYHVFEISPFQQYTLLYSYPDYRSAKSTVSDLRRASEKPAGTSYRMMFAADAQQAERLLKEKREPRPMGEHD